MNVVTRAAFGATILAASTFGAIAASEHDNDVYFAINGLQTFNFVETGHSITSGQPYGGTTATVSDGKGQITVSAGRKGSSSVASWFKQQVGSGQTLVCDTKGTYPDDLNFAVEGTLTIGSTSGKTITCDNIIVAQGNFGTTNNWWMGGPGMKGAHISISGATEQTCQLSDSKRNAIVIFAPQTPCVNNFSIGVIQP
ncbi:MAG TPA: hypothetical protein VHT93_00405 [Pseudolabrys sp.]|jgi:hypothetical protein|nr:hypothetical protein [Pseudolabrys sp.]